MELKSNVHLKWLHGGSRYLLVALFIFSFALSSFGQKVPISGTVKSNSDGTLLLGVTVGIKGTSTGTVTDVDGAFSIEVEKGQELIFSFIGFTTKVIEFQGQKELNVFLEEDTKSIDEVVVIGYGSVKRKDITGSVSSVSSEEIARSAPITIEQSLQGRIPGMVVTQTSGQPGGGISVKIHGITGFGDSRPLYVLDGVELEGLASAGADWQTGSNPLAGLNPSDIESIDVLKDASATAIYGSKGTDGVIIITTKRGRIAPPKVDYQYTTGFQQLTKKLPVMNLQEYATFVNERNEGIGWGFDAREELANPEYLGKGTDWQDELFRNAPSSSHTLTVSGGDTRTQYMLSAAYQNEEGIALGSDFKRISVRLNLDNKTTDWLKTGTSLQLVNIDENTNSTNSSVVRSALEQTPDIAVQNNDGSWGGSVNTDGWVAQRVNPYAIALINKNEGNRKQILGNLYAEIMFAKGLVLRNEASGNFSIGTQDQFLPNYKMGILEKLMNEGTYSFNQGIYTTLKNYITYSSYLFDNKYSLTAMAGHEAALSKSFSTSSKRTNFPSNNVQAVSAGDPTTAVNSGTKGHWATESYFGRLNFGINDKYLLTGNIREDGASMYAKNHRWITSYSGAVAWKINNENFLKSFKNINELKLRVGYGLTNRRAGRDYVYTSTLATVSTGVSTISQRLQNIGNPDLEWEQTKNSNIGLDGTFLNWRINFALDFYLKKTDGLAMQASLPMYSGTAIGWNPGALDAPWINVGAMQNKGVDFRISSTNIKKNNFSWRTDFTVSHNINEVLKLNTDGAPILGQYSKTVVGRSIGDFYGYVVDGGVFANAVDVFGDAENGIEPHARPVKNGEPLPFANASGSIWYGDLKFKDLNGDGIIDENDQTYLGTPVPKVQLGFNNSFYYKNFDLNVFFNASIGHKVFNQLRVTAENPRQSYGYFRELSNYAKLELIDPEGSDTDPYNVIVTNPDTDIPGVRNDNTNDNVRFSDKFIEDGTFVRCRNISLGYTLPENLLQRVHIGSLRVYANVTNAFTITKYSGMDPEIGSWDPINAGIDNGYYPQSRRYTLGVNITLSK